jgi:hypothetical protein
MMSFAQATELVTIPDLDDVWAMQDPGRRLRSMRQKAEAIHDRFQQSLRTIAVRTLPLSTLLYPTKYAFWGTAFSPAPYVAMTHRCLLVQFFQNGQPKILLFNPTDVIAARRTPFFARIVDLVGETMAYKVLSKQFASLESQLEVFGIKPEHIDYLAFDHFHTQDLRTLLGTTDGRFTARFPKAKLLAPRNEWYAWDCLHPMQKAWFVADGKLGVNTKQVVLTENDLQLGDGVWLFRTPGHTVGNQTLIFQTESGIWGCSENGTCVDSYSPLDSTIAGLVRNCRHTDMDVVLNSNTPEGGAKQYDSMILERTLVDRVKRAPTFVQMFASSEITPSAMAPGLSPTLIFGEVTSGQAIVPESTEPAVRQPLQTSSLSV